MTDTPVQTTEALLAERATTHGEYTDHARCTQAILRALGAERNWPTLPDTMKESLHMFAHKMARVVTGNPDLPDHWDDIAGYAKLISQRLVSPVVPYPSGDFYSALARGWGVTRAEAKKRAHALSYSMETLTTEEADRILEAATSRRLTPQVADDLLEASRAAGAAARAPGSPEDGGQHVRDERETPPYVLGNAGSPVVVGDKVYVRGHATSTPFTVLNVFPERKTAELNREVLGYGNVVVAEKLYHARKARLAEDVTAGLEHGLSRAVDQGMAEA